MQNPKSNKMRYCVCTLMLLQVFPLLPATGQTQAKAKDEGVKPTDGKAALSSGPRKAEGPMHRLTNSAVAKPATSKAVAGGKSSEGRSANAPIHEIAAVAGHGAETPSATILVRANSEVNGGHFTLGEIADIQCKDKALLAQLTGVEIGSVSLPGMERMLGPGDIIVHLRAAGLSRLLESKRLEVVAPPEMRVLRAAHNVTADEITQAAIASALIAIKDLPNASLEAVGPGNKLTVPTGKVRIVAGAYRGQPESGTLIVPVNVVVDGKIVQTSDVTLRIRRKIMVVVARRTLEPHDIISANDVTMSLVDLPAGFAKPLSDTDAVIGKRALRRILAESPVSAAWLETPPDITPNTRLTIEYVFGSVRITAPGLARQGGMIGETIRVYAPDTHKDLEAVIINDHTVRLIDSE